MKIINVSGKVWMWVHWKYGMSPIVGKLYPFGGGKWSYFSVSEDFRLNRQKIKLMTHNVRTLKQRRQ